MTDTGQINLWSEVKQEAPITVTKDTAAQEGTPPWLIMLQDKNYYPRGSFAAGFKIFIIK